MLLKNVSCCNYFFLTRTTINHSKPAISTCMNWYDFASKNAPEVIIYSSQTPLWDVDTPSDPLAMLWAPLQAPLPCCYDQHHIGWTLGPMCLGVICRSNGKAIMNGMQNTPSGSISESLTFFSMSLRSLTWLYCMCNYLKKNWD